MKWKNQGRLAVAAAALSLAALANPTSLPAQGNPHANGGGTTMELGE